VPADHLGLEPVQLEQLEGLRIVARGDLNLVAAPPQELDQRPEDEDMGRRGHVHPDLHLAPPTGDGSRRAEPGSADA